MALSSSECAWPVMLAYVMQARRRIAEGTYDPRTDKALQACLQQLAWWHKT